LAQRHGTVLLNGSGFHGPAWSARVSLANLDDDAYAQIGKNLRAVVRGAVEKWELAGRPTS
jgi:aspartate 4-decarboxylase